MHRDDPEFKELYPFAAHYYRLNSGHKLHYIDTGRVENQPQRSTLLMLHGNPSWSFFYRNLIKEFAPERRVIAPDHLGMGFSDKPQSYAYTLDAHITNLNALLENITRPDERLTLIVHDWGGAIGMGWAVDNIERLDKMVILNTAAFLSQRIPLRINICRIPLFGAIAIRGCNAFAGAATFMAVEKRLPDKVKEAYLLPYNNWQNRIATLRFVEDIPLAPTATSYARLKYIDEHLKDLQSKKLLILWGGKDWCFNDHFFKEWQERFPQAEAEYYPDGGHYILEDKTGEVISRLINFLHDEDETEKQE